MTQLPLLSSNQIISALKRAGFKEARKSSGTHQAFVKDLGDKKITTIVVLGKKEVPIGTLKSIIKLAEMSDEEFLSYVK